MKKDYHVGDVLSVTTGVLVAPRGMGAVYDILGYMTGESLFTHQLPRACKECRPWLLKQFPALAGIAEPKFAGPNDVAPWLAEMVAAHGETLSVEPVPPGENGPRDPIQEAIELFGRDRVIVVVKDTIEETLE